MLTPMIPILLYHSMAEKVAPPFRLWAVSPAQFAAQLEYLREHHYTPLSVSQLISLRGARLPKRPVVVTFDDGFADFYTDALPLLERYSCPATLYITTGYVGQTSRWLADEGEGERPMLSWAQVRELPERGVECGVHSCTHPQLDTLSVAQARAEVVSSKEALEQQLGQSVTSFAYPHGYYSGAVKRLVQEAGFSSACAVKHAMSTPKDDAFALSRIIISADTGLDAFAQLLGGHELPIAPQRESWKTKGWRLARRSTKVLKSLKRRNRDE